MVSLAKLNNATSLLVVCSLWSTSLWTPVTTSTRTLAVVYLTVRFCSRLTLPWMCGTELKVRACLISLTLLVVLWHVQTPLASSRVGRFTWSCTNSSLLILYVAHCCTENKMSPIQTERKCLDIHSGSKFFWVISLYIYKKLILK